MGLYNNTAETERLLTENYERYYRLAFKLMRNQDDALDVVQESAYRAIKDCKGVRNKDYHVHMDLPDRGQHKPGYAAQEKRKKHPQKKCRRLPQRTITRTWT
mgnify:CR=1 FL=1